MTRTHTRSGRQGISLVEVLVAAAVGVVVLSAAMMIWVGGTKAGHAAQSSVTATALALMELSLREDVMQMGPDPACPAQDVCRVSDTAFALEKVSFARVDAITVHPVIYQAVPSAGGNMWLRRTEGTHSENAADAVLSAIRFRVFQTFVGHCLGVTGLLLDADTPPGPSTRSLPFTIMLRIPEPVDRCNSALGNAVVYRRQGPSIFAIPFQ